MDSIVVDLGGTHLRCGVARCKGVTNFMRTRVRNTSNGFSTAEVWSDIIGQIASYALAVSDSIHRRSPVIFAFPGPVTSTGLIVSAPTLAGTEENVPDLAAIISETTGRRVFMLNDLSAAAWYFCEKTDVNRFMVVTVSSGIGSKVVDRRHPLRVLDDVWFAGEIGHIRVRAGNEAPLCDCGLRGHLGAISSGRGVERLARRLAHDDTASFNRSLCARELGATPSTLANESHLVPAARLGDPWTIEVITMATRPLVDVLSVATVAIGLERVIVIGGFALQLGDCYLSVLRDQLTNSGGLGTTCFGLDVAVSLGDTDEACLHGAAAFARSRVLEVA